MGLDLLDKFVTPPMNVLLGKGIYNLVVKCFPSSGLIIALLVGPLGWKIMSWRLCVLSS
jgi:hypothetical protein